MTDKEKSLFVPDFDFMFSMLFNKSLSVKEEFASIQKKGLIELLKSSKADIAEGKKFTSEEVFAEIDKRFEAGKEDRQKDHENWIKVQNSLVKETFSTDLITYLWNNQKENTDQGYYNYWDLMDNLLCLHQRLDNKNLAFEINVISNLLYQKTPYSEEQYLPLFEFKSKGLSIKFMMSDPISDSWLVMVSTDKSNNDNKIWADNSFSPHFYQRLLASLPNELQEEFDSKDQSKLSYHLSLRDKYDLHGLICQNYALHSA
jgi:hypothetical protein